MTGTPIDLVTGASTEVSLLVDLPPDQLWELVTDVPGYGRWSPECVHTAWLGDGTGRVGDRFIGRNRFGTEPDTFESTVTCVVTESRRPDTFAWHVLDSDGRPASLWRYDLASHGGGTLLRHRFEHGPGHTVARSMAAAADPPTLDGRLDQLRHNIAVSLAAMLDGTHYQEVEAP